MGTPAIDHYFVDEPVYTHVSRPFISEMWVASGSGTRMRDLAVAFQPKTQAVFTLADLDVVVTRPSLGRHVTLEEDQVLWAALRASARVVHKGKLKT